MSVRTRRKTKTVSWKELKNKHGIGRHSLRLLQKAKKYWGFNKQELETLAENLKKLWDKNTITRDYLHRSTHSFKINNKDYTLITGSSYSSRGSYIYKSASLCILKGKYDDYQEALDKIEKMWAWGEKQNYICVYWDI